jgi:hypothetical protein
MNLTAMRTAGRFLGAWAAIAFFVGLASLTFTFVGTIACAVLVGMMMGAFKGAKWFSVLVSAVFPAVIFGMTRSPGSELTTQQIHVLEVVCFGTFWVVYLVSALVVFSEQKDGKASCSPAPASRPEPAEELCLEQLQGNWVCEPTGAAVPVDRKIIEIKDAKLELKAIDVSGQITLLARGEVMLHNLRHS